MLSLRNVLLQEVAWGQGGCVSASLCTMNILHGMNDPRATPPAVVVLVAGSEAQIRGPVCPGAGRWPELNRFGSWLVSSGHPQSQEELVPLC